MCNCYFHKCEECKEELPIHIGDFRYDPKELLVWCAGHLPRKMATVFTLTEDEEKWPGEKNTEYPRGWTCAIRLCSGNIEPESSDVGPNLSAPYKITILD